MKTVNPFIDLKHSIYICFLISVTGCTISLYNSLQSESSRGFISKRFGWDGEKLLVIFFGGMWCVCDWDGEFWWCGPHLAFQQLEKWQSAHVAQKSTRTILQLLLSVLRFLNKVSLQKTKLKDLCNVILNSTFLLNIEVWFLKGKPLVSCILSTA